LNNTIVLSGNDTAWKVIGANVDLYAAYNRKDSDEGTTEQLYHFMTLEEGTVFRDIKVIDSIGLSWFCIAKCTFGAALEPAAPEAAVDFNQTFGGFAGELEDAMMYEGFLYPIKKLAAQETMEAAIDKLVHVNQKISAITEAADVCEPEAVKACRVLCRFLNTTAKVPAGEVTADNDVLIEEILHLSGIRFKDSLLADNWWKQESGPLLATLDRDIPVVLLPHVLSGYSMYDSRKDKNIHVNAAVAARIRPEVKSVYRTLPAKKLKLPDIGIFIAGEHIYKDLLKILFFSMLAALVQILPPIVSAQIFDSVIPGGQTGLLIELVFIVLAFEIANIGFSVMINLGLTRINIKWDMALQAAVWDRLLNLKVSFFHEYTTGELLEKIKGLNEVRYALSPDFMNRVLTALFSFVNIYVLFRYIPAIAPYVLLLFLVALLVSVVAWRVKYRLRLRYVALSGRATSINHQIIRGMERIKISAAEERVFQIWSSYESESRYLQGRIKMLDHALSAFYLFFQFAATAMIYLLIFWQGGTEIGSFIAFISSYLIFQNAVFRLLKALNLIPDLLPVIKDFTPLLEAVPEYAEEKSIPSELDGSLEVNHVTFRYQQYGQDVLRDISFKVNPGESLGIIGASGSGKSTLLKLLFGFYEPTGGKIYIGGNDLGSVDLRYLRQHMSIVLQDGRLTVGSIYSNIKDNNPLVTEEDVRYALKVACLEEDVDKMPGGMFCSLDDGEHMLSMDQKQKLLIARAVAKRQPYFLLDEATSSFDAITQAEIMKNIKDFPATKIIIAQRLSTLVHCDRVLVLDRGAFRE